MVDEVKPWEQQPDEPTRWFMRFSLYYLPLGAHRSLLAAYNAWRREKGRGTATGAPEGWRKSATRWRWAERVEAWDLAQAERFRIEFEGQRRKNRIDSIAALMAARERVMRGVMEVDPSDVAIDRLVKALAEVEEQLRVAYGDVGRRDELRVQDEAVVKGYGGGFTPDDWPDGDAGESD
jgi:ribosomal protein L20A (L18A)